MSLTSYRAAPPRDELVEKDYVMKGDLDRKRILFIDLAATYSPAT
jgi:hypothetical protein